MRGVRQYKSIPVMERAVVTSKFVSLPVRDLDLWDYRLTIVDKVCHGLCDYKEFIPEPLLLQRCVLTDDGNPHVSELKNPRRSEMEARANKSVRPSH